MSGLFPGMRTGPALAVFPLVRGYWSGLTVEIGSIQTLIQTCLDISKCASPDWLGGAIIAESLLLICVTA
jgi:hypothetical protein